MRQIWAKTALLPHGWAKDVSVTLKNGRIQSVKPNAPRDGYEVGLLLPAPVNVHSHSFQRAMAGLTERRGPNGQDSFWTWRNLMYRFLDRLTPEHIKVITAFVQMEMLEAGYAANTEFHYLHHQQGGKPYNNIAEISAQIVESTRQSGIGLTLLPVLYQYGGCDGRALGPGQNRFGNNIDSFIHLHEEAQKSITTLTPDAALGVAPHSLRAVARDDLARFSHLFPKGPIHMHLAEQKPEVDEVQSEWGARPVEWVLDHLEIDARWCMIHCTQMTDEETARLAQSGAVAGLCPITESSLGDGIFNGMQWINEGGTIALGSDSNIRISLTEELRTLDYSQRLRDGSRAAFASPEKSTGRRLFDAINQGGALASGRESGQIAPGNWADLLSLDETSIHLEGRAGDTALDAWIFAGSDELVRDVWSAGRHMVQEGRHINQEAITEAYRTTIRELKTEI